MSAKVFLIEFVPVHKIPSDTEKSIVDKPAPSETDNLYLVFKQRLTPEASSLESEPGVEFRLFRSPLIALPFLIRLARQFGYLQTLRLLLKLATPSRCFFAYFYESELSSFGWITHGHCHYYDIEADASVIGPIYTNPQFRGRGHVVKAMRIAMKDLTTKRPRVFYIDTHVANIASQRSIMKAGFDGPVARINK